MRADERRRQWAYALISRCAEPPPSYLSAEWLALPDGPKKVAAVVLAAEAFAMEWESRKAAEDVAFRADAEAHRSSWTGRGFRPDPAIEDDIDREWQEWARGEVASRKFPQPTPSWARHYQDVWHERSGNSRLPRWLRVVALAYGCHDNEGHARFKRGEIALVLGSVDHDTGAVIPLSRQRSHEAVRQAVDLGFLADGSLPDVPGACRLTTSRRGHSTTSRSPAPSTSRGPDDKADGDAHRCVPGIGVTVQA